MCVSPWQHRSLFLLNIISMLCLPQFFSMPQASQARSHHTFCGVSFSLCIKQNHSAFPLTSSRLVSLHRHTPSLLHHCDNAFSTPISSCKEILVRTSHCSTKQHVSAHWHISGRCQESTQKSFEMLLTEKLEPRTSSRITAPTPSARLVTQ